MKQILIPFARNSAAFTLLKYAFIFREWYKNPLSSDQGGCHSKQLLNNILDSLTILSSCRCGEMVDAADSKSALSNRVLVRVQSSVYARSSCPFQLKDAQEKRILKLSTRFSWASFNWNEYIVALLVSSYRALLFFTLAFLEKFFKNAKVHEY